MNSFALFFLSALVVAVSASSYDDIKNINLEDLLADEVRRKAIFECIMDQAPCAPEYQVYRDVVPGILETQCEECTQEQKTIYAANNKILLEKYPTEYNAMVLKYGAKNAELSIDNQ